ncbi:MAG: hypothetical protein IJW78_06060 [Clostridia bacterium]|nr:hypothetical protein [Clostridia bacterium]
MKKIIAFLLTSLFILLVGCTAEPAEKFIFTIDEPKTTLTVGEKVTYTVKLKNCTNREYSLAHGLPLMSVYIVNADDESEFLIGTILTHTDIKAGETIEKNCKFQPMEAGEYLLKTFCHFKVDSEEYDLAKEAIPITVLPEKES